MSHFSAVATIAVFIVVLISITGCRGDESPKPAEDGIEIQRASATENNVVTAVSDAGLDTLARLLIETGLDETLRGEGPYTLFAPSDAAFTQLPGGGPDGMSPGELTELLKYHVIPGRFETSSLDGAMDIRAVNAGTVTFSVVDGNATVTDASDNIANVTQPDINVDNGVVQVIDRVLIPISGADQ